MKNSPLIGITPGYQSDKNRIYSNIGYIDGVNKAGGCGLILPLTGDENVLEGYLKRCEAFLLSGGPDVDARLYGEMNYKYNGAISPTRDSMEIFIAKKAVEMGKPVFGICRGVQVLNIALGGSIYQDIYSQIKDVELLKHSQEAPDWYPVHDVNVLKDSLLWKCYERESLGVNSFHHQAVKDLGKGLKAVAWSGDGVIEAVEHESHPFAVGVQWHPELMWQENVEVLKLFEVFVHAAC